MIPRGTILAAVIAVAVGVGWVVWVKMEPAPAPDAPPPLRPWRLRATVGR